MAQVKLAAVVDARRLHGQVQMVNVGGTVPASVNQDPSTTDASSCSVTLDQTTILIPYA